MYSHLFKRTGLNLSLLILVPLVSEASSFSKEEKTEEKIDATYCLDGTSWDMVTYNTHLFGSSFPSYMPKSTKDDNKRASCIARHLKQKPFDLVGLQEVFDCKLAKHFEELSCYKTRYFNFEVKGKSFLSLPKWVSNGLALMSRYEIKDCEISYFEDSGGLENLVSRGVLAGYIPQNKKPKSGSFCVFVTHTHWGGDDVKNRKIRMKNIAQLRTIVDLYCNKHKEPSYIILGDLNITYGTEDYRTLMKIFSDCGDATPKNDTTCDPFKNKLLQFFHPEYVKTGKTKIDYILYSKKYWSVEESYALREALKDEKGLDLSDHYALYAKLRQKGTLEKSEYEDYDKKSIWYDKTRVAVGVDILCKFLTSTKPLEQHILLDAGIGTGNYAEALLNKKVKRISGIDLNESMLKVAKRKLKKFDPSVEYKKGSITQIPYQDQTFSAVYCCQVVHHLEVGNYLYKERSDLNRFFEEAFRVLQPGGLLILNITTQEQYRHAFWYTILAPKMTEKACARLPKDIKTLFALMRSHGFKKLQKIVCHEPLQGNKYEKSIQSPSPLSEETIHTDSGWALASDQEVCISKKIVDLYKASDQLTDFMSVREELREKYGQSTFVVGIKSGALGLKTPSDTFINLE